ncbi:tail length tape-measure protein 1 [Enterobacter phage ATCEA23]|nr:tail length tape measure protein [Enterobacter phage ATCEA85]QQV93520.1 tail length tape-measure protein 1 [Enterobacter phage ATCEA23]
MSDNTERLIVDVDASGVNRGAKTLDDFVSAAQDAGRAADGLADQFDQTGKSATTAAEGVEQFNNENKKTDEAAGDAAVGLYKQNQELQQLLDRINPTRVGLRDLADQQQALARAQASGMLSSKDAEEYNRILATREGILKNNEAALKGYNVTAAKTKTLQDGMTISTGQYNAAMGMLPAQMTDIVTQLAGGQNPFLIMIQQGGQIKDSFGGVNNTLKAMKQFINPAFLGLAATAAIVGALGYAAYTSSEQTDRLASSLILMGGAGFKSAQELNEAAESIADKTGSSIRDTVDTLIELNNKGNASADQMKRIAQAVQTMSRAGIDAADSMKQFDTLIENPIKGIAKLNEQYGFLDEKEMKRLITLQKTKGDQAAATEAVNIYANAMEKRSQDVIDATDNVGQAWLDLKSGASNIFRDIGITLRAWGNQAIDIITLVKLSFQDLINSLESLDAKFTMGVSNLLDKVPGVDGKGVLSAIGIDVDEVEKRGNEAIEKGKKIADEFAKISAKVTAPDAQAKYEQEARTAGGLSATGATDQKSREAVSKLADDFKKAAKEKAVTVSQGDRLLEQYQAQELALQAQILTLKNRNAFDVNASEQMKNYQLLQAKITILEGIQADAKGRKLTKDEQSLLANKNDVLAHAKKVALLGDEVKQLERQAQISDELVRSTNDMNAQIDAVRQTWGMTADEAERYEEAMKRAAALRDKGATEDQITEDADTRERLRVERLNKANNDFVGAAKTAVQEWGKDVTSMAEITGTAITGAMDMGTDALNNFVMTGKAGFADLLKSFLSMVVQMINKWLVFKAIQGIGGAMGFDMSFMTANANGGVYSSPSLSAYKNGVYDSPQFFNFQTPTAFANGGVFAEAGPEAIMPLTRDASGRLGVTAQGGAGGGVQIGGVTVNVAKDGSTTSEVNAGANGRAMGEAVRQAVQDGIEFASQPGGRIWVLMNGHG